MGESIGHTTRCERDENDHVLVFVPLYLLLLFLILTLLLFLFFSITFFSPLYFFDLMQTNHYLLFTKLSKIQKKSILTLQKNDYKCLISNQINYETNPYMIIAILGST